MCKIREKFDDKYLRLNALIFFIILVRFFVDLDKIREKFDDKYLCPNALIFLIILVLFFVDPDTVISEIRVQLACFFREKF